MSNTVIWRQSAIDVDNVNPQNVIKEDVTTLIIKNEVKKLFLPNYSYLFPNLQKIVIESTNTDGLPIFIDNIPLLVISKNGSVHNIEFAELECSKIEALEDSVNYFSDGSALYSKDKKILYWYFGEETNVVIPEGVEIIWDRAFKFNDNINYVKLPTTLKEIEQFAFGGCENLINVDFSNSNVEIIKESAFVSCSSLAKVEFPCSLRILKSFAFSGCDSLSEVILNDGLKTISSHCFSNSLVPNINLPSTVDTIGDSSFEDIKVVKCSNMVNGLIDAITIERHIPNEFIPDTVIVDIGTESPLVVPKYVSRYRVEEMDDYLKTKTSDTIPILYPYGIHDVVRQNTALEHCSYYNDEETQKYIASEASKMCNRYINNNDINRLEMLSEYCDIEVFVKAVSNRNLSASMKAYLLDIINRKQ